MNPAREYTIFLIDDDALHLQLLSKSIKLLNTVIPTLKTYTHAEEALDYITANVKNVKLLPDYIFLDINMPGMDGWQFLTSMTLLKNVLVKKITIFMLSSSDDEQDTDMLKHYPEVKRYLTKPIKKKDLAKAFY